MTTCISNCSGEGQDGHLTGLSKGDSSGSEILESPPAPPDKRFFPLLAGSALIVMTLLAYLPILHGGFIMDDDLCITQNPLLTVPDGMSQIWFSTNSPSQYFPLVYTTFRLEYGLWGFAPAGFHLVNVLWHGLNAVLVWMLLRRLAVPGSWLAAAIFALHPVEVETVAWCSELKSIESLFFYLLATFAWINFLQRDGSIRWGYYTASLLCFLLAMFAKTTACTLPAVLVLMAWLLGRRFQWTKVFQIVPFMVVGLIMGIVSIWWESHLGNYDEPFDLRFTPVERMLIATRALWFYAGKLCWPENLMFSYPRWAINPADLAQYLPLVGCLAVVGALWLWRRRIRRDTIAGLIFFVAALSPLLGFIVEGTFHYTYVADHYQYNASLGLIAIIAASVWNGLAKFACRPHLTVALLLILGGLVWQRCFVFFDQTSLWKDTLAKNSGSWMAHHNLGIEYFKNGQIDAALEEYESAVKIYPQGCPEQSDLGTALMAKGLYPEAIEHLEMALKINPNHFPAQNNLALAYEHNGDGDRAVLHYSQAIALKPKALGPRMNLGRLLKRMGRFDEAIDCYRQTVSDFPAEPDPPRQLVLAFMERQEYGPAKIVCQQALLINPDNAGLRLAFGNLFLAEENYREAAANFQQAINSDPNNAGLHYNLGLALSSQGRLAEARDEFILSLKLKPDFSPAQQQLILLNAQNPQ